MPRLGCDCVPFAPRTFQEPAVCLSPQLGGAVDRRQSCVFQAFPAQFRTGTGTRELLRDLRCTFNVSCCWLGSWQTKALEEGSTALPQQARLLVSHVFMPRLDCSSQNRLRGKSCQMKPLIRPDKKLSRFPTPTAGCPLPSWAQPRV